MIRQGIIGGLRAHRSQAVAPSVSNVKNRSKPTRTDFRQGTERSSTFAAGWCSWNSSPATERVVAAMGAQRRWMGDRGRARRCSSSATGARGIGLLSGADLCFEVVAVRDWSGRHVVRARRPVPFLATNVCNELVEVTPSHPISGSRWIGG